MLKKKVNVFASGEKTVSESYECVHKFVTLKHAIIGVGVWRVKEILRIPLVYAGAMAIYCKNEI